MKLFFEMVKSKMNTTKEKINGYDIVKIYKDKELVEEQWYKDGILNRKDAPSIIKYRNGLPIEKHFYYFGVLYFLEKL